MLAFARAVALAGAHETNPEPFRCLPFTQTSSFAFHTSESIGDTSMAESSATNGALEC